MLNYEVVDVDLSRLVEISNGSLVLYDSEEIEEQKLLVSDEKEVDYRFYRDLDGCQRVIPIRFTAKPL